jgi:outer membrane lipoprotein-sorting protein
MSRKALLPVLIFFLGVGAMLAQVVAAQSGDAARGQELLKQARAALGGEEKLAAVKSVSISGSRTVSTPMGGIEGDLKLDFQSPDKYRQSSTMGFTPENEVTLTSIVNGEDAGMDRPNMGAMMGGGGGTVVRGPGGGPGGAPDPSRLKRPIQDEYVRLLAGILLGESSALPVEFLYTGDTEEYGEQFNVLEMKGADHSHGQLLLDAKTHLPRVVRWRGMGGGQMVFRGPGGQRPAPPQGEAPPAPREVQFEFRFLDHKAVDGILFPMRITRAVDGEVREEWRLSRYRLNTALKPSLFEIKKQQ